MTQIAQGAHVYLFPEPGQVYRVQADDVATVQVLYGAPSAVITLTAQSQTFGPYDSPAKLKVTANTGQAEYTLIRAHYVELTQAQIDGGAVGALASDDAGGVIEPDGDVPTLGGSVTLPAMQTAFDAGTAPQKAAFQSAVSGDRIPLTQKGAADGVATLGADAKIPAAQLPDIAIVDYLGQVANQSAMLALTAQKGDWCSRTDTGTVFVCVGTPTMLAGWKQLAYPASAVQSVAGLTGAVTLEQLVNALAGQYATAAQGAKADSALQPAGGFRLVDLPVGSVTNAVSTTYKCIVIDTGVAEGTVRMALTAFLYDEASIGTITASCYKYPKGSYGVATGMYAGAITSNVSSANSAKGVKLYWGVKDIDATTSRLCLVVVLRTSRFNASQIFGYCSGLGTVSAVLYPTLADAGLFSSDLFYTSGGSW